MHPRYDGTHPSRVAPWQTHNCGHADNRGCREREVTIRDVRFSAGTPDRQPRYPFEQYRCARGPEALRPRLATGLPICDGRQLIGERERIQLSATGHSDRRHSIRELLRVHRRGDFFRLKRKGLRRQSRAAAQVNAPMFG